MPIAQVSWTSFALKKLQLIYKYYADTAGTNVADKIADGILSSTDILITQPRAGREEEMLKQLGKDYRYLVKGNYKIIYNLRNNIILIHHVFDSRQNPKKLLKEIK